MWSACEGLFWSSGCGGEFGYTVVSVSVSGDDNGNAVGRGKTLRVERMGDEEGG